MDKDKKIVRLEAWSKAHKERQNRKSGTELLRENLTPAIEDHRAVLAVLRMLKDQEAGLRLGAEKCVEQLGAEEVIERLGIFAKREMVR